MASPQLYLVCQIRGLSWEFQGVFSTIEAADAACKTRAFFIYPVTLDEEQPTESTPPAPGSISWPRCNGLVPIDLMAEAPSPTLLRAALEVAELAWSEVDHDLLNGLAFNLLPQLRAAISDGYVLAPPAATMEMRVAGFESVAWDELGDAVLAKKGWPYSCRQSAECVAGIYAAMLAASAQPAAEQEQP